MKVGLSRTLMTSRGFRPTAYSTPRYKVHSVELETTSGAKSQDPIPLILMHLSIEVFENTLG